MFSPFGRRALSPPRAGTADTDGAIQAEASALLKHREAVQRGAPPTRTGVPGSFAFPVAVPFTPPPKKPAAAPQAGPEFMAQLSHVSPARPRSTPVQQAVDCEMEAGSPESGVDALGLARAGLERRLKEIKSLLGVQRQVIQEAVARSAQLEEEREAVQQQLEQLPELGQHTPAHPSSTSKKQAHARTPCATPAPEALQVQTRSYSPPAPPEGPYIGLEVGDLPPSVPIRGVGVSRVDGASPAGAAGIREGDIITEIGGRPTPSLEAFNTLARDHNFLAAAAGVEGEISFHVITEMAHGPGLLSRVALVPVDAPAPHTPESLVAPASMGYRARPRSPGAAPAKTAHPSADHYATRAPPPPQPPSSFDGRQVVRHAQPGTQPQQPYSPIQHALSSPRGGQRIDYRIL